MAKKYKKKELSFEKLFNIYPYIKKEFDFVKAKKGLKKAKAFIKAKFAELF